MFSLSLAWEISRVKSETRLSFPVFSPRAFNTLRTDGFDLRPARPCGVNRKCKRQKTIGDPISHVKPWSPVVGIDLFRMADNPKASLRGLRSYQTVFTPRKCPRGISDVSEAA
jgi:hypothetical protein